MAVRDILDTYNSLVEFDPTFKEVSFDKFSTDYDDDVYKSNIDTYIKNNNISTKGKSAIVNAPILTLNKPESIKPKDEEKKKKKTRKIDKKEYNVKNEYPINAVYDSRWNQYYTESIPPEFADSMFTNYLINKDRQVFDEKENMRIDPKFNDLQLIRVEKIDKRADKIERDEKELESLNEILGKETIPRPDIPQWSFVTNNPAELLDIPGAEITQNEQGQYVQTFYGPDKTPEAYNYINIYQDANGKEIEGSPYTINEDSKGLIGFLEEIEIKGEDIKQTEDFMLEEHEVVPTSKSIPQYRPVSYWQTEIEKEREIANDKSKSPAEIETALKKISQYREHMQATSELKFLLELDYEDPLISEAVKNLGRKPTEKEIEKAKELKAQGDEREVVEIAFDLHSINVKAESKKLLDKKINKELHPRDDFFGGNKPISKGKIRKKFNRRDLDDLTTEFNDKYGNYGIVFEYGLTSDKGNGAVWAYKSPIMYTAQDGDKAGTINLIATGDEYFKINGKKEWKDKKEEINTLNYQDAYSESQLMKLYSDYFKEKGFATNIDIGKGIFTKFDQGNSGGRFEDEEGTRRELGILFDFIKREATDYKPGWNGSVYSSRGDLEKLNSKATERSKEIAQLSEDLEHDAKIFLDKNEKINELIADRDNEIAKEEISKTNIENSIEEYKIEQEQINKRVELNNKTIEEEKERAQQLINAGVDPKLVNKEFQDIYKDYKNNFNNLNKQFDQNKNNIEREVRKFERANKRNINKINADLKIIQEAQEDVEVLGEQITDYIQGIETRNLLIRNSDNYIKMQMADFQEVQELYGGKGDFLGTLVDSIQSDFFTVAAGRVESLLQVGQIFNELQYSFGGDEEAYEFQKQQIKSQQKSTRFSKKAMTKMFKESGVDDYYAAKFSESVIGGTLQTWGTMFASTLGMGGAPLGMARGFFNLSLSNSYEELDNLEIDYVKDRSVELMKNNPQLTNKQARREAQKEFNKEWTDKTKLVYATTQATVEGTLEFVTTKILGGSVSFSKPLLNSITRTIMKTLPKGRKIAYKQLKRRVNRWIGEKAAMYLKLGGRATGMGFDEMLTEYAQEGAQLVIKSKFNDMTGIEMDMPDFKDPKYQEQLIHLGKISFLSSFVLGGGKMVAEGIKLNRAIDATNEQKAKFELIARERASQLRDPNYIEVQKILLQNKLANDPDYTEEQYNEELQLLETTHQMYAEVDPMLKGSTQEDIVFKLQQIKELEEKLKGEHNNVYEKGIKEEIKILEEEVLDLQTDPFNKRLETTVEEAFETDVKVAEKLAIDQGATFKVAKNRDEFIKKVEEAGGNLIAYDIEGNILEDNTDADAVWIQDKDNNTIIINKEQAIKLGAISSGVHEVLHQITRNQLLNKDEGFKDKLVEDFKKQLSKKEFNAVQARINKDYSGDKSTSEEWFNAFSDAIVLGDIKYNETVWDKIGNWIIDNILKPMGLWNTDLNFDSGKGVYNFVKNYGKEIREMQEGKREASEFSPEMQEAMKVSETEVIEQQPKVKAKTKTPMRQAASRSATPLQAINALIPSNITTKQQYDAFMRDEVTAKTIADALAPGGVINNYIRSKQTSQIEGDKMIDEATMRLFNFNPETKRKDGSVVGPEGFGESIFANTRFAQLVAKEQLFEEGEKRKREESIDTEEARQLADVTETTTAPVDTKAPRSKFRRKIKKGRGKQGLIQEEVDSFKTLALDIAKQLPDVENKNFRSQVDKLAGPQLKKWVKENIFKGENYEQLIIDNYELIRDEIDLKYLLDLDRGLMKQGKERAFTKPVKRLTTQADIRKYKDSGRAYVEDEAQGVMLYDRLDPGADFMVDFYTKEMPSTVSNRKGKLQEAFGKTMFKDFLPQIKAEEKAPTKTKARVAEKIQRPPTLLFSKSGLRDMAKDQGVDTLTPSGGKKEYSLYDFTGNIKDKNKKIKLSDKEAFKKFVIEVLPTYLPVEFITKSSLAGYGSKAKAFYFTSAEVEAMRKEAAKNQKNFTAKEIAAIKQMVAGLGDSKSGIWSKIKYLVGTEEYRKKVDLNYEGLGIVWNQFQNMIKDNKNNLKFIVAMLETGSQSSSHWLRNAAMPRGYDKFMGEVWNNKTHRKEHVWPQNMFAEFMLGVAIKGAQGGNINIDKVMPFVKDNYFQMLITLEDDNKLKDVTGKYGDKYNYGNNPPKVFLDSLEEALKTGDLTKAKTIWIRYINPLVNNNNGGFNLNSLIFDNATVAELMDVKVPKKFQDNNAMIDFQNELTYNGFISEEKINKAKELYEKQKTAASEFEAIKSTIKTNEDSQVMQFSKSVNSNNVIHAAKQLDKALNIARNPNAPIKKIRVFDFDDTIAKTKSKVIATKEGKTKRLTAEAFAKDGEMLEAEGWKMDFSDFNKVVDGKKGPLFDVMKKMKDAAGERDIFVLTARAPEAAKAIHRFLKEMGVEIPINNIQALGNSSPLAKSDWIVTKAAEGYNDFYFADDHRANVEAVKKGMSKLDVKSKTQLVKQNNLPTTKFSKSLNWKKDEAGNINSNFKIKDKNYTASLVPTDDIGKDYYYEFELETPTGFTQAITGTGDAVAVFRTVYNGLLDAVKQNSNIRKVEFSARKGEVSRIKLYTSLMNKLGKDLGWETDIWETTSILDEDGGHFDFEISKPTRQKQSTPVKKALDVVDVKSPVQQAKMKFSKSVDQDFNKILENSLGVESFKEYSPAKAKIRGEENRKLKILPYSAEDFEGLLYPLLGKGKKGEQAYQWFDEHLIKPYSRAMSDLSIARVNLMADFKALKEELNVPKELKKKNKTGFTNENAIRVYIWSQQGESIPGLSKTDIKELIKEVENNPTLRLFAQELMDLNKGKYISPQTNWLGGTITTDLIEGLNSIKREEYLKQWKENVDLIFSEKNLNKLEAKLGYKYREALENILDRMYRGSNRVFNNSRLTNRALDYLNNAQGVVMFLNIRSAVLQGISSINFLNWTYNSPLQAGKAFANQKQYWKDFMELMNSDYLKDRRAGLRININEAEIANAAATSKNKAKAAVSWIIQKGYLPTQFMDSFAIASGGATWYRNRVNDLIKKGMTEAQATKKAMQEFREIAEKSQQSSRPDRISSQQASGVGRVMLNWANTQMQYVRIQKRAIQDLINRRGDPKEHLSKIVYYGIVQNLIFNAAQQALFAIGFGDDDDEEKTNEKIFDTINGAADGILRGLGIGGHVVSVLKNYALKLEEELSKDKGRTDVAKQTWELIKLSPVIYSKISRIKQAAWYFDSKKRRQEIMDKGFALDNPAYEALAKVISATTNVPVDRLLSKFQNIEDALSDETEFWMDVALLLGWPKWQLEGRKEEEKKGKRSYFPQSLLTEKAYLQEQKEIKEQKIFKLKKEEQVKMLDSLGVDKKEINSLKLEKDRVNKILQLQNKPKSDSTKTKATSYKPSTKTTIRKKIIKDERTKRQARLYKLSKQNQIDTLTSLGVTPAVIKTLKYEEDRVRQIEKLYDENK